MIVNWLVLALIVLLGGAFILLAGRRQRDTRLTRLAVNRELYQQRQEELQQEAEEGVLSATALAEARTELDRRFLADNEELEAELPALEKMNLWWPALAIVVITVVIYFSGSSWRLQVQADEALLALPELGRKVIENDAEQPTREELDQFALGLRQKLARKPDDAVAWLVYGRVMLAMGQREQAIDAMAKSYELDPRRLGTLLSYAQLLLSTGDEQYLSRAARLLAQALQLEPTNIEALSLLGFVAYEQGDWAEAEAAWKLLLQQLPEDDERYAAVVSAMADARERQAATDQELTVTVALADELAAAVPQGATLFVYVRAPAADGAPAMPAAVVRQPVSDFPVTVRLSDGNAMLADYQMSDLPKWQVFARISADESIDASPGDLDGRSGVIDNAPGQQLELTISERRN